MSLLPKLARTLAYSPFKSFIIRNSRICPTSSYNHVMRESGNQGLGFQVSHGQTRNLYICSQRQSSNNSSSLTEAEKTSRLTSQMNFRHVNENSFLSWCRNTYLNTVLGMAMMEEATSTLAQGAGFGCFLLAVMSLTWGTGCHLTNLIRLRHVTGMSTLILTANVCGSSLHFAIFLFVLVFYLGFLEEKVVEKEMKSDNVNGHNADV